MRAVIRGTGAYIPERIVENAELAERIDTSDEWIRERTGIRRRHVVMGDTVASMAAKAGKMALENAGIAAEEIELILVSTTASAQLMPCNACLVQNALGAVHAACFDINAACSGFVTAYQTACAYMESGRYKKVLVIGSEALSNWIDWSDRTTCVLFGDGAGAVVLTAEEGEKQESVCRAVCGADGTMGEALTLYGSLAGNPFMEKEMGQDWQERGVDAAEKQQTIHMDGQAVFRFAVRKVPQIINELLADNHLQKEDIKFYVLHQANERILEAAAKRMGEPIEKFPMHVQEYGNTSSASIPILLHELWESGRIQTGDKLVIAGFGGGLTWAASVVSL